MKLNELRDNKGARKAPKCVGRGIGCGKGKTCGRGIKGQKSRTGVSLRGFEGGQMPIHRRLPKRGFRPLFPKRYAEINLARLQQAIDSGKIDAKKLIDEKILAESGVVTRLFDGVRLLGKGQIKTAITISVTGASASAIAAIEKAGGKVEIKAKKQETKAA